MSSIFLSHNRKDKPFVRRLNERLQAHGIRVWVDEAEMQLGDSLLTKIESAIRDCHYLGVVLSPHSITSEWVRREVNMALTEELHGNKIKVLPLLYQPCEIPGFLKDKLYADFTEDFETGLETLLARLKSDIQQEERRHERAYEILQETYLDWLSFDRQDAQLLRHDQLSLILQYLNRTRLSPALVQYLCLSIAHLLPKTDLELSRLKTWLDKLSPDDAADLYNQLLNASNPQIRLGSIALIEQLEMVAATDAIIKQLNLEDNRQVKRDSLRCLTRLGKRLAPELAQKLINASQDWLTQSYALLSLGQPDTCLLISDNTDFAAELGGLAEDAGFQTITFANPDSQWEIDRIEYEVLQAFRLVILVRGEHYTPYGRENFYSILRRFVAEGGALFATPWVSFEATHHKEFAQILPFKHFQGRFNEDIEITCRATANEWGRKLFPQAISYKTSVELLQRKTGGVVLLETEKDLPILGYRRFGAGICYYLNSCQHSCWGAIKSPLQTSPELAQGIQKVFRRIHQTPVQSLPYHTRIKDTKQNERGNYSDPGEDTNRYPASEQEILNLSRRLQKLREIRALKGIDTEPHYLLEIEDIEATLDELTRQRKHSG